MWRGRKKRERRRYFEECVKCECSGKQEEGCRMIYSGPEWGWVGVGLRANEALTFMELMSRFCSFLLSPFRSVTSVISTAPLLLRWPSIREGGDVINIS